MTFFTKYKLLFASLVAFLLSFAFVSCNVFYFGADDDEPTTTTTSSSVSTVGSVSSSAVTTNASGNRVATLTDSNGGVYTFTETTSAKSARATTAGGSWTYQVNDVVKYSGTYMGDISLIGSSATSLRLTIKEVANSDGKLVDVEEEKSFDFVLTETSFSAEISAVEVSLSSDSSDSGSTSNSSSSTDNTSTSDTGTTTTTTTDDTSGEPATNDETKTYTVTVSDSIANGSVTVNATSATAGTEITLTAAASTGYDFSAWNVTDASGNAVTVTNNKFSMPASNVTVSATFTATATEATYYTVTFNSNGGSDVASQTVTSGSTATEPTVPTKKSTATTRYTFAGWYNGDTKFDFSTAITANITLTAHWTETAIKPTVNSITVVFNNNASDLELEKDDTETGIITYTVPADYDVEHVLVDSGDPDDAQGFTLSNDSRTLTITEADLKAGHWYDVYFVATKGGRTYSVRFQITKE